MSTLLSLPSELTIYAVAALQPAWLAALASAIDGTDAGQAPQRKVRVAAAAVDEVDAAGLQLLLALSNALALRERQLQLVLPSHALAAACAALGASALLDDADLEGATT